MKNSAFLLFLFCSAFSKISNSQIDSVFVKNYGGPGEEAIGFGTGIAGAPNIKSVRDAQGNIYIASYTNSTSGDIPFNAGIEDILVVKTDADGQIIWSNTFGGSGLERIYSIKLLSDGNILVCGRTNSNDGTFSGLIGGEDAFLMKLSPVGSVIWSRLYGGSLPDYFFDVIELPNGDLMACGISGSIDGDINDATYVGSNKAWVMRISSIGAPIWSRITNGLIINPDWEESFWFVRLNAMQNGIYLLGASYNFNDINSDDLFLVKYDLNGTQEFKTTFGGNSGDSPAGLFVNQNDEIFALGTIRGSGGNVSEYFAGNADAWLVKLNLTGTILWDKTYGGSDLDYAYGLTSSNGSFFISMSSRSTDQTCNRFRFGLSDGFIVEVSESTGDTISTYRWGSTSNDYCHEVMYVNEGEFYAVGRSSGNDEWISQAKGGSDLVLIRFRDNSLQINQLSNAEFSVYPNPCEGKLYLEIPENYQNLFLYNSLGTLVHREVLKNLKQVISMSEFPTGIYFIHLTSDKNNTPLFKRILLK